MPVRNVATCQHFFHGLMSDSGRFVGRAPDIDEGDGGVEPVEDDEGHRGVAQEGPKELAVELDPIVLL